MPGVDDIPGHDIPGFDVLVRRAAGLIAAPGRAAGRDAAPGGAAERAGVPGRAVLGIAGAPGSGKSTLAARLVAAVGPAAAWVPMDGFHLADAALDRLGLRSAKGAPDTFDGWGYLALLRRLAAETGNPVYAPDFERTLEQPIAGSIAVGPPVRLVVTEGNYLLLDAEPWTSIRRALTEVWYVEVDEAVRLERLIARHVAYGKEPAAARDWVAAVDEPNARLVAARRAAADLTVSLS
jgi:pantothenate kinase